MATRTIRRTNGSTDQRDPMVAFGATMDRLFGTTTNGGSRGQRVLADITELAGKPVTQRVYTQLAILAVQAKTEGFGGAVLHFKLADALVSADLGGRKPYEVCEDLERERLIRSGRSKGGKRMWFVAALLDAPEKGSGTAAKPNAAADLCDTILGVRR